MRALITGAAGQDGTILATMLSRQGADVIGLVKPGTEYSRLQTYVPSIEIRDVDMSDADTLHALVHDERPTHVWNLGGFTAPAESWDNEDEVFRINTCAVEALLAACSSLTEQARFFQASSSHVFEGTDRSPQDETFELSPASPYARSKAQALAEVRRYRESEGMFSVSAVLYNHESPLRSDNFVTRKISKAVARIAAGQQDTLQLGDIEVARDWGWAPDYVRAMLMMLTADAPRDFVLATGISHRLSFFVKRAFAAARISDWQSHVVASESDRPIDTNKMVGNPQAAYLELGWRHTVDFDGIARRMVKHDIADLANPDLLWTDF
jgi:GDPmannose 4,6-dehydratase